MNYLGIISAACLLLTASCNQSPPRSDISGGPPQRIVSLGPNITEILFAIGCGGRVVGVTSFCRYPPQAGERTAIGGYYDTNYELILSLRPDLVLMTIEHETAARNLRVLNLNCRAVDTSNIPGIFSSIRQTGALCSHSERADALITDMQRRIHQICFRIPSNTPPPGVLISIGRNMGMGGLSDIYLAGQGTIYDEMLVMLGAENVFQGRLAYAQISREGIIRMNPDVIIDLAPNLEQSTGITREQARADWRGLTSVSAVRNGRIYVLSGDYVCIPGPRITRTLEDMARVIYPEIFGERLTRK